MSEAGSVLSSRQCKAIAAWRPVGLFSRNTRGRLIENDCESFSVSAVKPAEVNPAAMSGVSIASNAPVHCPSRSARNVGFVRIDKPWSFRSHLAFLNVVASSISHSYTIE